MSWESNPSVYMVSSGIPFHSYSLPRMIGASIIVIIQAFLSCFPNTFKNLFHQTVFGVTMFAVSFVTLTLAKDYAHFVLSMVILALGESAAMSAVPAHVDNLSPVESKGKYQGLTVLTSAIGRTFGPLSRGLVIDKSGYVNFFIVAAAGISMMPAIIVSLHAQLRDKLKISR